MPRVGNVHYPYTKKGKADAAKARAAKKKKPVKKLMGGGMAYGSKKTKRKK